MLTEQAIANRILDQEKPKMELSLDEVVQQMAPFVLKGLGQRAGKYKMSYEFSMDIQSVGKSKLTITVQKR